MNTFELSEYRVRKIILEQKGIYEKEITEKEYNKYNLWDEIVIHKDIKALVLNKFYYPLAEQGNYVILLSIMAELVLKGYENGKK